MKDKSKIAYSKLSSEIDEYGSIEVYCRRGPSAILRTLTSFKRGRIYELATDPLLKKMKIGKYGKEFIAHQYQVDNSRLNVSGFINQWTFPLYFLNYTTLPTVISKAGDQAIEAIPWQWSCHILKANCTPEIHSQWIDIKNWVHENNFKRSVAWIKKGPGTVIVWGSEKSEYLSGIVENDVRVVDMQLYAHGYYLHELAKHRLPRFIDPIAAIEVPMQRILNSTQPLFPELNDETMVQYVYADLVSKPLRQRQNVAAKLAEYFAMDTLAMARLYKIWAQQPD